MVFKGCKRSTWPALGIITGTGDSVGFPLVLGTVTVLFLMRFFFSSMVASCDTTCLSMVFFEGEFVPRKIFGTLLAFGEAAEAVEVGLVGLVETSRSLDAACTDCFSKTKGIVLPLRMRLEAGEVAEGLATITPGIVVGCKKL